VAKRMLHRSTLVHGNPHLKIIDSITITEDEKVKARLLHAESPQQVLDGLLPCSTCPLCLLKLLCCCCCAFGCRL